MAPKGPYKLVTVNSNPERAHRIVGRIVEELKDIYTIVHAANAENPEVAKSIFEKETPDIVFTASMWTEDQSSRILAQAREVNPNVKTLALPQGLQAQGGPDAIIGYVKEHLPAVIES